ncbi:MAG: hypothetical protein ACR2M1_11690, partial [Gemmatimonadaceae bacterium]
MIDDADRTGDRLMNDEAVEDAVLGYLNENPHLIQGIAPTRDLWSGIESRITARVLPLGETAASRARMHHVEHAKRGKPRWTSWVPMAAAAAVLISASASVTYVLTKHGDAARSSSNVAAATAIKPAQATSTIVQPLQESHNEVAASDAVNDTAGVRRRAASNLAQRQSPVRNDAPASARLASHSDDEADTRAVYDEEIRTLRSAVEARRSQLDPATVKTIEQNLNVIDDAIAQSRAALAKDPKSQFLSGQLDRSLAKKTDL